MHQSRSQPAVPYSHTHTHSWTHISHTHTHTQMHSWAHVYTGSTDADRWERLGCAPGIFAHPTHQSTFHTDGRVEEVSMYAGCLVVVIMIRLQLCFVVSFLDCWNLGCPFVPIVTVFAGCTYSPHIQFLVSLSCLHDLPGSQLGLE